MKTPRETARQASAREAREEAREEWIDDPTRQKWECDPGEYDPAKKSGVAWGVQEQNTAKPAEPRPVREPANLAEEWANLNYVINAYLEPQSRSDELLGKLKVQLKAYDEKVREKGESRD